ncbi:MULTISPECIES: DUF2934 domain-containing protein [unclassified Pseudomonas]|uniref:DUF2934 domain-containing protein n=1 Tax=unclassified Pseudomonas TaxID=196821 RepID=UPI001C456CA0|nr:MULTISPECIES: DUF2934 domain-containing protein [unclassified Pseudomonas]
MTEESQIRERAYELWERDGRPEGAEEFYWRLAQEQFEAEVKSSAVATAEPVPNEGESSPDQSSPTQQGEDSARSTDSEWPAKGEASRYEGT